MHHNVGARCTVTLWRLLGNGLSERGWREWGGGRYREDGDAKIEASCSRHAAAEGNLFKKRECDTEANYIFFVHAAFLLQMAFRNPYAFVAQEGRHTARSIGTRFA